jgi:hypothetical protein
VSSSEKIEQLPLDLGFSADDIRSLCDHTEFSAIPFKSNQLCNVHECARDILNHPVSTKYLATLVEMNERTVRRNLLPGPQEPGSLGGHNALDV